MCPYYSYGEPCKNAITKNWCVFRHDSHTFAAYKYIVTCVSNREKILDPEIQKALGSQTRTKKEVQDSEYRLAKYPKAPNHRELKNIDKLLKTQRFKEIWEKIKNKDLDNETTYHIDENNVYTAQKEKQNQEI